MFIPDDPGPDPYADMKGPPEPARCALVALCLFAAVLTIAGALLVFVF